MACFKADTPSPEELGLLTREVCSFWKALGKQLGLTCPDLLQIEADNQGLYEQCYSMLKRWTQVHASPPTYEELGRALQSKPVERRDLAVKFCSASEAQESREVSPIINRPYKHGKPTEEEILRLSQHVQEGNWKQLGRALKLEDAHLEEIDHNQKELFEKIRAMFSKWTQVKGRAATYRSLAQGLDRVGRRDLIRTFCEQIVPKEEEVYASDEDLYESVDELVESVGRINKTPEETTQGKQGGTEQGKNLESEQELYKMMVPSYTESSFSPEWKEEPVREVIISKVDGISEEDWSEKKLYNDLDEYFHRFESSDVDTKSKVEQKLLREILPSLESESRKTEHHSRKTYEILAKLGCWEHSQGTVKHSLYILRRLLTKDNVEQTNARTFVKIEKILRASFSSKGGLFNLEGIGDQRLRLTVYSKVLCLLAICRCKGFLTAQSIEREEREDANVLLEKLKECFSNRSYQKKDELHHVAELTLTSLKWIFDEKQPMEQLSKALQCFKELLRSDSLREPDVSRLVKKLCGCEWFCLHVTFCCIEHEMRMDPKALDLLFRIVEKKIKMTPDWRLFTAVSGILSNATMTNKHTEIREKAGSMLVEYLQNKGTKFKKTPEVMAAIERKSYRVLFSPDANVRTSMADVLSPKSKESISAEQTMNYLCWFYRSQALERKRIIRKTNKELVYMGSFQGQKVAIKTMRPSMRDLARHELEEMELSIKSAFVKEAYFLRRLHEDAKENNIIRLLCCDSERIPYHLITEFFANGNLLEYLRLECRSETPLRTLATLSQWCLEILKALVFLLHNKIVHKKIMARSVLVAEDEVCKLSGFSAAVQAVKQESGVIMCSPDKVQLGSPGNVCWLAPEVLTEGCYSSASDVWAFGVLMHEVFSLGCEPCMLRPDGKTNDNDCQFVELIFSGEHLPKLSCFDDKIYQLMERCWMQRPSDRNSLKQLRSDLLKLQQEMSRKDARMPAKPPNIFPEVKPQGEEDGSRRLKVLTDFLQTKQEEAFTGNVVKTAATTLSLSTSGGEDASTDAVVLDEATGTSSAEPNHCVTTNQDEDDSDSPVWV